VRRHLGVSTHQQHIGSTRHSVSTQEVKILHGVTIFQPRHVKLPQRVKVSVDLGNLRPSVQIGAITFQLLPENMYHLVRTQAMRLPIGATIYQHPPVLGPPRALTPLEMLHRGVMIYQQPPVQTRHTVQGLLQVLAQQGPVIRVVSIQDGDPRLHGVRTSLLLQEATHHSALAQKVPLTVTTFQLLIERTLLTVLERATGPLRGATTYQQLVEATRLIVQVLKTLCPIGATRFQLPAVHTLLIASMRASMWLNGATVSQLLIEI